jgi:hypothetical protein
VRTSRAAGEQIVLAAAQRQLAREHGFASWPQLKRYLERADAEQPFHTDIAYYEDRAAGIASVNEVTVAEGRLDLARRHGFSSWAGLRRHVGALRDGQVGHDVHRSGLYGYLMYPEGRLVGKSKQRSTAITA